MKQKIREEIRKIIEEILQETKDVKQMYKKAGMNPPHPGKGIHTKKFHKCVTSVGDDKGKNPYAICMASLGKDKAVKKSHQREGEEIFEQVGLEKIKKEFGAPPIGADIRDVNGQIYVYYYSKNPKASNWAQSIREKYSNGIIFVDTLKI